MSVSLVVPQGTAAGTRIQYTASNGTQFDLVVLEEALPGSVLKLVQEPASGAWSCTVDAPRSEADPSHKHTDGLTEDAARKEWRAKIQAISTLYVAPNIAPLCRTLGYQKLPRKRFHSCLERLPEENAIYVAHVIGCVYPGVPGDVVPDNVQSKGLPGQASTLEQGAPPLGLDDESACEPVPAEEIPIGTVTGSDAMLVKTSCPWKSPPADDSDDDDDDETASGEGSSDEGESDSFDGSPSSFWDMGLSGAIKEMGNRIGMTEIASEKGKTLASISQALIVDVGDMLRTQKDGLITL